MTYFGIDGGVALIELGVGGLDGQPAAIRHGIAGVDRKIEHSAFQLTAVDGRRPQIFATNELDLDVLAERTLHQRRHVAEQRVDVGRTRHQRLAPAEGEEPRREIGAVLGGKPHRLCELAQALVLDLRGEHLGVEQDGGQHVVEVVGDAAGQLADGLHALRLGELGFRVLLVGDVGHDRADAGHRAGGIDHRELDAHQRPPAAGRLHDELTLRRGLGRDDRAIGRAHVFRGPLRQEVLRCHAEVGLASFGGPSLGGAVDEGVAPLEVLDEDENRGVVHDGLKLRLAGAQGGIDLVAFCHRVRMRAARCGDPEPCDREHEPHADGDPEHDAELGAPGGQGIPPGNRDGDQRGRTREVAPSGEILCTTAIDRRAQDAAGRAVPPSVQNRPVGNRLAGRVPGERLPEQQKSVGMDELDDPERPHVDRRIKATQPVGLKGRREQSDEAPLQVAQCATDRDGHPGESGTRHRRRDDQAGARIVLQSLVEVAIAARRPRDGRIGRQLDDAVRIDDIERPDPGEPGQGRGHDRRPRLARRLRTADTIAVDRQLVEGRFDRPEGAVEMLGEHVGEVLGPALLRQQDLIVLPPQGNRACRDEDQKHAHKRAIDSATPLQRIGLGTRARGLLVHARHGLRSAAVRRRAQGATEPIRSTIYRTRTSDSHAGSWTEWAQLESRAVCSGP